MRLVIVTGVSGAGKSTALRALEDMDYYCADNLPLPLLPKFVELLSTRGEVSRAALGIDARSGEFLADCRLIFAGIRETGHDLEILFLDAPDDVLIRRFSETRRRHPLFSTDIRAALAAERAQLVPMRQEADAVIDTGGLTMPLLRALIQDRHRDTGGQLSVNLMSFGFKNGLPPEADIVLDVRFLPNPFLRQRAVAVDGRGRAGPSFRPGARRYPGILGQGRGSAAVVAAGVRQGRKISRDDRHRLHGWSASFRRRCQRIGATAGGDVRARHSSSRHFGGGC